MKVAVIIACILISASASATLQGLETQTGKNCNTALTAFTVNSFDVSPWPPHKNTNLAMVMGGVMNQPNTLKAMNIYVIYNGKQFYQESTPESGTYAAGQSLSVTFKAYLPFIAPSGSYGVQTRLANTAGVELNCWEVDFTL